MWAERYDRSLDDVFDIQDEITVSVGGAIEPEILISEGRRAGRKADLDACECCMRGTWHHCQTTRSGHGKSERWLRRAIEIDPGVPRSHMALARMIFGRILSGWSADAPTRIPLSSHIS